MPECKIIRPKRRRLCTGDLNIKIDILSRSYGAPVTDVDFSQNFSLFKNIWAALETSNGRNNFYVTNLDISVSHIFYMRWIDGLEAEKWIEYKNENYDILEVENLEERDEWAICYCNVRGVNSEAVNNA